MRSEPLKRVLYLTIAACACLFWSATASAANYVYYIPNSVQLGSSPAEVYVPSTFSAQFALSGQALVDACRKELETILPGMRGLYEIKYQGLRADVTLAAAGCPMLP